MIMMLPLIGDLPDLEPVTNRGDASPGLRLKVSGKAPTSPANKPSTPMRPGPARGPFLSQGRRVLPSHHGLLTKHVHFGWFTISLHPASNPQRSMVSQLLLLAKHYEHELTIK